MLKYIIFALALSANLLGYNDERTEVLNDKKSLDFSDTNGRLNQITLVGSQYYSGKSNLGIEENTNLKTIIVNHPPAETIIRLSYLPGVETYALYNISTYNFDYLPKSLPFLKTLQFTINCGVPLEGIIEDVSKLEHLENLVIVPSNYYYSHGFKRIFERFSFTDQEMEALSKLYRLKRLIIHVMDVDIFENIEFDMDQLEILQKLLPHTQIIVKLQTSSKTITLHQ